MLLRAISGLTLVAVLLLVSGIATAQALPAAPSATVMQQQPEQAPPPPAATPKQAPSAGSGSGVPIISLPGSDPVKPPPRSEPAKAAAKTPDQGSAIPENAATETIKIPVNEVNLIFTATDRHGHFIKDLKESELRVVDDHKPVDQFRSFANETNLPLRVGLLVDASNSIRDRFQFEQQSAVEFLAEIVRPKTDQAFVIGFDETPVVTQDFTNSTEKLATGIRELRPGGGTALFDAVYFACRDKLMKVSLGEAVRRAIILVSDGNDNQSHVTREQAIEMAQRAEVIVYAISTNTSGLEERGDKILQRIAEETGGRFFQPFKLQDVANAFTDIQEELRSQYALSYKPPEFKADGSYRTIEISSTDRKAHIRARKGYFAPSSK